MKLTAIFALAMTLLMTVLTGGGIRAANTNAVEAAAQMATETVYTKITEPSTSTTNRPPSTATPTTVPTTPTTRSTTTTKKTTTTVPPASTMGMLLIQKLVDGWPSTDFNFEFFDSGGNRVEVEWYSTNEGAFVLEMAPGAYTVYANIPPGYESLSSNPVCFEIYASLVSIIYWELATLPEPQTTTTTAVHSKLTLATTTTTQQITSTRP